MSLANKIALHIANLQMGRGQDMRRTQFAELVPPPGSVVMLGDSITEGGIWNEWFPGQNIVNRGIGGETSHQVLLRTHSALNSPGAVFPLIGSNDLTLRYTPDEIAANVRAILRTIREASPGVKLYLQSIMPRGTRWQAKITTTNMLLTKVAQQQEAEYVDLWPKLADKMGNLREGFTGDGLHLTGAGYRAWCEVLRPLMAPAAAPDCI